MRTSTAERRIDCAEGGTPIRVEFACVDEGADLSDIAFAEEVAEALKQVRDDVVWLEDVVPTA